MLLDDIGAIGNDYLWSILELEAEGDLGDTQTYIDIDNAIKHQNGYCLTWDRLKELASKFDQVINTIIVASKDINFIAAHKNDFDNMYKNFPLVIAILDGDFWEVSTSDDNLIKKFKSKYEHVEIKNI
jgi:hypothetical protein